MILAELSPNDVPFEFLRNWWYCLILAIAGAAATVKFCLDIYKDHIRTTPPTNERFVAKENYNTHCTLNRSEHGRIEEKFDKRIEKLVDQMAKDKDEIITAGDERVKGLHDRLTDLVGAVGELKGRLHERNRS